MKLKTGKELDDKALDDAEYEEREDFSEYDGPLPPRGTVLSGRIKRVWYAMSQNDNPMLKVIFEAEGNKGEKKVYNGLGIWDNITFTEAAAFRYKPFLALFGLTVKDIKTRTDVDEEDNVGLPVNKVGKWEPGSDEARCRVTIKHERYEGERNARVGRYMPFDADEADEDSGGKKAKKGGKAAKGKKAKGDDPF